MEENKIGLFISSGQPHKEPPPPAAVFSPGGLGVGYGIYHHALYRRGHRGGRFLPLPRQKLGDADLQRRRKLPQEGDVRIAHGPLPLADGLVGDTWSVGVLKCLAFGWAVCYPLLRTERPVRNALVIASIGVYPFLLSLGLWEMRVLCIVIASVAYAWAVYWIWLRWRGDWRKLTFLVVVLGILLRRSGPPAVFWRGRNDILNPRGGSTC